MDIDNHLQSLQLQQLMGNDIEMIKISLHYNKQGDLWKFNLSGHAGYADHGQDIVCAAVSMLVINTINSIHSLTKEPIELDEDVSKGYINCTFPAMELNQGSKEALLLVNSMILGLKNLEKEYGKHIQIRIHPGGE